jgi:peptidoglycan/LPS O-acetylase OafA/YrhL
VSTRDARFTTLDGLRGLGIFLVFLGHVRLIWFLEAAPDRLWETWLWQAVDFNWISMEAFFVLSGFLVTGILLRTRPDQRYFRNFYSRRVLRIFPLYYGFLAVYLFVLPRLLDMSVDSESAHPYVSAHQAWYWSYTANFLIARHGAWLGEMSHFWSLAVEEHFYLLWPLVVYFLSDRAILRLSVAVIVVSTALRAYLTWVVGLPTIAVYVMTITRLDSILMGSMIAVLFGVRQDLAPLLRLRPALTALSAAFVPVLVWLYAREGHFSAFGEAARTQQQGHLYPAVAVFGYLLAGLMCTTLIVWLITGTERQWIVRLFQLRPLRTVGQYSYGIYVVHFLVLGVFHQSGFSLLQLSEMLGSRALGLLIGVTMQFAVTLALGWMLWHGCEKHFLALKRYFEPDAERVGSRVAAVAATTS